VTSAAGGDPSPATAGLGFAGVVELRAQLDGGELTASQLLDSTLRRIEEVDRGRVRSVLALDPSAAAAAERAGEIGSPVSGIPVLIKDTVDTAGVATTAGSLALVDCPPPARDAVSVARLRAAGAVVVGKTNPSEWSNLRGRNSVSGWSAVGGQTHNPHVLDRSPGGSSAGSGAAVAAGLVPAALASETDGSILCPASLNGIVGVKPTVARVPRTGAIPISHTQDSLGVLACDVRTAAAVLTVLAGPDAGDPASLDAPAPEDYLAAVLAAGPEALRGARLGVPRTHLYGYSAATDALIADVLAVARSAGATIVDPADVDPADAGASWPVEFDRTGEFTVLLHEMRAGIDDYLLTRLPPAPRRLEDVVAFNDSHAETELALFGQEFLLEALQTAGLTDPGYLAARESVRAGARRNLDRILTGHRLDALVVPTTEPAWRIDTAGDATIGAGWSPSAVAGYPAVSLPAGLVGALPVGVALLGTAWSETRLLVLAAALEAALGPSVRPRPAFLSTVDAAGDGEATR
jgi:amidase